MNGTIYGCLCLRSTDGDQNPRLDLPFDDLPKKEVGNHLLPFYEEQVRAFDFQLGAKGADSAKVFASSRGTTISGYKVGEDHDGSKINRIIKHLLALNSNLTEEEANAPFLDLAYKKIFQKTEGHLFVTLNIVSDQSKFMIMSRDLPVYMFTICDDNSIYLLWSNEQTLEQRMREHYGSRFYYYRMQPLLNCTCVIQSNHLKTKLNKWLYRLRDRLKIMNALEAHLIQLQSITQPPVNEGATSSLTRNLGEN